MHTYELWFRLPYNEDLAREMIHACVRPGDRRSPLPKGTRIGEITKIRIIAIPGSEERGIMPTFTAFEALIRITDVAVKTIGELTSDDLRDCSWDARTGRDVKQHLEKIYGRSFGDRELVTLIRWDYLHKHKGAPPMRNLTELTREGILAIGAKAKDNPDSLDLPSFALGIANKDYPARTPFLWNRVYAALGLETRNVRMFADPENAPEIFGAFRGDPRYIGGDVGVGYKDRVLGLLDDIDPLAQAMGAINVIRKINGKLKGYNTDGAGFAESIENIFLKRLESLRDKKIVLLGAGGTANAIAFALAAKGASVIILNRTVAKAADLADRVNRYFGRHLASSGGRDALSESAAWAHAIVSIIDDPHSDLDRFSVLAPIELPATPEHIAENLEAAGELLRQVHESTVIADVMLRDHDTATIAQAKHMGFETLDGSPMVLNQAIEAFSIVNEEALSALGADRETVAKIMKDAAGA